MTVGLFILAAVIVAAMWGFTIAWIVRSAEVVATPREEIQPYAERNGEEYRVGMQADKP